MKIQIQHKNVYGNDWYYPVCEQAKIFASISNKITLTLETLELIKMLGYEIEVVPSVTTL